MAESLKSLFEYTSYREFLRDFYRHSKATRASFSFRLFSRLCSFKSSNFLMLVMNGKSRLSTESTEKVIKGLKFNKEEAHFFRHLVAFNEAKTADQKADHAREMLKSKSYKKIHPLSESQYLYLSTWFLPVIRSAVGLPGFNQKPEWIANHISPSMAVEDVKKALAELVKLGLLIKDQDGNLTQANGMLVTPNEVTSSFAAQYHRQMLQLAAESIDRFKRDRRHLVGLTVAIDEASIQKVKEITEKYRNDIMEIALNSQDSKSIYQVNIQAFPVFQTQENDEEPK